MIKYILVIIAMTDLGGYSKTRQEFYSQSTCETFARAANRKPNIVAFCREIKQ